jgi:hypothetical protein
MYDKAPSQELGAASNQSLLGGQPASRPAAGKPLHGCELVSLDHLTHRDEQLALSAERPPGV